MTGTGTHTVDVPPREAHSEGSPGLAVTRIATAAGPLVVLSGELDLATAPIADHALREAERDARALVLDLRPLTFMGAAGLTVVLDAAERARAAGRRFVVHVRSTGIRRLFELTRADRRLEIVVDLDA